MGRKSPFKSPIDKRMGLFWLLLFLYAFLWINTLQPRDHYQVNAFIATIPMFAYVVIGLWFDWRFMFWLGLIISGLIFLGFFLLHGSPWMWLWMAVFGGGGLALSGLVIWKGGRIHAGA
jgi:hypothetical protein